MKVNRKICRALSDKGSSIVECSEIKITKFNKNPSGSKCKQDSVI